MVTNTSHKKGQIKERQDDNKSMNIGFCSHVRIGIGVRERVDDVGVVWGFVICMKLVFGFCMQWRWEFAMIVCIGSAKCV